MRPVDRAAKRRLNEVLLERKGGRMQDDRRQLLTKVLEREAHEEVNLLSPSRSPHSRSFYTPED